MNHANRKSLRHYLSTIDGLDAANAIRVIGGSEALYQNVLRKAVASMPDIITLMDQNLSHDLTVFSVHIHSIKSTVRQLGHARMALLAETLEKAARAGEANFCNKEYPAFRNELSLLHGQLADALRQSDPPPETRQPGVLRDFRETLLNVQAAADDFDCLLAAELFKPLTQYYFGDAADAFMAQTAHALERYQPQTVSNLIATLLDLCDGTISQTEV